MKEVIRKEGDKWVLYSSDGKKKLGEFDSKEAALKRERQIQYFKHAKAAVMREAGFPPSLKSWWASNDPGLFNQCVDLGKSHWGSEDRAKRVCAGLHKAVMGFWPGEHESLRACGVIGIPLEETRGIDAGLAAEMEFRGIKEVRIDTDTRIVTEIREDGSEFLPAKAVPAEQYTPKHEAIAQKLVERGLLEVGARHTQREFEIIKQVIQLMSELYGEVEDLNVLLAKVDEAIGYPTIVDYLISVIHSRFTSEADDLFGRGRMSQEERKFLSHCIGQALDAFNATLDAEMPMLRERGLNEPALSGIERPGTVASISVATESAARAAHTNDYRPLFERVLSEAVIDAAGNLDGVVVLEGESLNGNIYTPDALKTGLDVFRGKQIFADHSTLAEESQRPERSLHDLVGVIRETYLGANKANQPALRFRGFLSETADWLKTLIREGIAGDMSINARGRGREQDGKFIVEAFTDDPLTTLDFVTKASAGGQAQLVEAQRKREGLSGSDIEPGTASASATDRQIQEASMDKKKVVDGAQSTIARLEEAQRRWRSKERRRRRKEQADQIVAEALGGSNLPAEAKTRVLRLIETPVRRFVEQAEGEAGAPIAPTGSGLGAGDAPTIEIPPDVAELPAEAQAIWLQAYTANLPKGEAQALHMAWAEVFGAGWTQTDEGWKKEQPEMPALPETMTAESLKQAIAQAATDERAYLTTIGEAGKVTGAGGAGSGSPAAAADGKAGTQALEESLKRWGLTPEQAKLAASSR